MSGRRPGSRTHLAPAERERRSQLAQLVSQRGVVRGSLLVRRRACGKPNCRCTCGGLHESLYLVITQAGKTRQLFVPKDWEQRVRRWVADYQQARRLMEELSQLHWEKVRSRKE